jgi:ribonuclease T1
MRFAAWITSCVLAAAAFAPDALAQRGPPPSPPVGDVHVSELPPEAVATLRLIHKGGPFHYAKDGTVFGNREGHLPRQKRGYYREFTVRTPGSRTRGARRIVKGASGELYYTDDHYNSFSRIRGAG